jgi:hypothetical protein
MLQPRIVAEGTERAPTLPEGTGERFSGYGILGLPFRSGHVLGLRRFPASSIGSGYTSVWHRTPDGSWTFYQDVQPELACPRYFGPLVRRSLRRRIDIRWAGPDSFCVLIDGGRTLEWEVILACNAPIRAMNAVARAMPDRWWHRRSVLRAMGWAARKLLGTGRLGLTGRAPSGQRFEANPLVAWTIPFSFARVDGADVGRPGPLREQEHLADFWIPQRGLFVVGRTFFEPLDPARHRCETHAEG